MVRPAGPNQMVNRMQGPGKETLGSSHLSFLFDAPENILFQVKGAETGMLDFHIRGLLVWSRYLHKDAVLRSVVSLCVPATVSVLLSGMNQFNQMGMQSMGQRSTPPLPIGASGNPVNTEHAHFITQFSF